MKKGLLATMIIVVMASMLAFGYVALAAPKQPIQSSSLNLPEELDVDGGCTAFGATGKATYDGFPLIGGTSDNNYLMRASLVYRVPETEHGKGSYKYIAAEVPLKGMIRAMNEKGFGFARNAIRPTDHWKDEQPGDPDGISNWELTVKFATECETVDDAIQVLKTTSRGSIWKVFTVADATGDLAQLYVTPGDYQVIRPDEDGWLSIANDFVTDEFMKYDGGPEPGTSSYARYHRSLELIETQKNKKVDPYMLMDFLRDTENFDIETDTYKSICAHGKNSGTIFGFVMQPALKIFWYAYGPPDGEIYWHEGTWGHFVPFAFPEMLPGQYVTEEGIVSPEYPYPYAREHLRLRPLELFPLR